MASQLKSSSSEVDSTVELQTSDDERRHGPDGGGRPDLARFEAVLLDVGNVILYDFPVELAYSYFVSREIAHRQLGLAPNAFEILRASNDPTELACKLGGTRLWEVINALAWEQVLDNWAALCVPIPGALESLQSLSHLRLAIVANQPSATMKVLERLGIDKLFSEIIFDSTAGVSKPDEGIYRYAARRLRARPESLIMIGDRLDNDILPAQAVGIRTAWVKQVPLDENLPMPHVSNSWRSHYFRLKRAATLYRLSGSARPDYVLERLSDLCP